MISFIYKLEINFSAKMALYYIKPSMYKIISFLGGIKRRRLRMKIRKRKKDGGIRRRERGEGSKRRREGRKRRMGRIRRREGRSKLRSGRGGRKVRE